MGCQMLESVSHDLQEVDLLIDGVGDGANIANWGTQQAGVRGVNDPNLRDGGRNGSPHGLVTADDLRFAMVQQ